MPGAEDRERIRALTVGVVGLMEAVEELLRALDLVDDPGARAAAVDRARDRLADTKALMVGFSRPRAPLDGAEPVLDLTAATSPDLRPSGTWAP